MAHLLGAEHISLSYPTKDVFDDLSLGLAEGQRIGIVGRNGDGKTTLLRLLAGEMQPDTGRVTRRGGITVGVLAQTPDLDPDETVGHAVVGDLPEHEWASQPRVRDVLQGLLGDLDWHATTGALSGGQRRRVALAALLRQDWDVLFLDEPTNHLDVEGITWLARHLKQRWPKNAGGLVMVTHDRWFLDAVCTDTWEVHDGTVEPFEGGYAAYILQRVERDRQAAAVEAKRQNLMRKELAWLGRGAPARSSKPKFRIEAANAIIADVPEPRDSVSLAKMATARLGKDVLDLEHVSLTLGEKPILDDVTLRLAPGERLGVVGVNGAGKSTLLRLLDGRIAPDSGRVKRGKTVVSATLTQDVKELDDVAHLRVAEVMAREGSSFQVGDREMSSGQLLEMLGFGTSRQWTQVSELSGGERRRLQLLRLLVGEPNVLMLDEPTNDLDTDTLAAVEDVLDGWPGTLVVVSHDRYLLERVTDHQVALLGDGKVRGLPGGVDQYLELRAAMDASGGPARGAGAARGRNDVVGTCAGMGGPEEDTGPTEAERRLARKEMARLEKQMTRLRDRRSGLEARMAELGQAQDFDALTAASADLKDLDAQLDVLEEEWLQAAELAEGD